MGQHERALTAWERIRSKLYELLPEAAENLRGPATSDRPVDRFLYVLSTTLSQKDREKKEPSPRPLPRGEGKKGTLNLTLTLTLSLRERGKKEL